MAVSRRFRWEYIVEGLPKKVKKRNLETMEQNRKNTSLCTYQNGHWTGFVKRIPMESKVWGYVFWRQKIGKPNPTTTEKSKRKYLQMGFHMVKITGHVWMGQRLRSGIDKQSIMQMENVTVSRTAGKKFPCKWSLKWPPKWVQTRKRNCVAAMEKINWTYTKEPLLGKEILAQ